MGRPREFDKNVALTEAMRVFWLKGYEATSMVDLMDAMELHKGSIYKAFGDKHQLFMSALGHYMSQGAEAMNTAINAASSPIEAIRVFMEMSLRQCTSGPVAKGCFMMNSAVELAPYDDMVREFISSFIERMKTKLVGLIERGQEEGQIRKDKSAKDLAEYVMFVKAGMLTGNKVKMGSEDPSTVIDLAISALN